MPKEFSDLPKELILIIAEFEPIGILQLTNRDIQRSADQIGMKALMYYEKSIKGYDTHRKVEAVSALVRTMLKAPSEWSVQSRIKMIDIFFISIRTELRSYQDHPLSMMAADQTNEDRYKRELARLMRSTQTYKKILKDNIYWVIILILMLSFFVAFFLSKVIRN